MVENTRIDSYLLMIVPYIKKCNRAAEFGFNEMPSLANLFLYQKKIIDCKSVMTNCRGTEPQSLSSFYFMTQKNVVSTVDKCITCMFTYV